MHPLDQEVALEQVSAVDVLNLFDYPKYFRLLRVPPADGTDAIVEALARDRLVARSLDYMTARLPAHEEIVGALRVPMPSFPEVAVRELLANALIHQVSGATENCTLLAVENCTHLGTRT